MSDEQFNILCRKIDNIANVIVIEGWCAVIAFATIVWLLAR